jgi:hypothetical protein
LYKVSPLQGRGFRGGLEYLVNFLKVYIPLQGRGFRGGLEYLVNFSKFTVPSRGGDLGVVWNI